MAFFRLSEWVKGYVEMEVRNDVDKNLLRTLATNGIRLWNARHKGSVYTFCLQLDDLHEALEQARTSHVKIRFSERRGLPFLIRHARKRKTFLVGGAMFVAVLYMLSSFVWRVEIVGADQTEVVEFALRKLNIYPGSWLYNVMAQDDVQLALLEALPQVSWVGVKIQGTSVFVNIIPRIAPAKRLELHPQNVVASVPGVVANILADSGQALVQQGEYVTPGAVLISGELDNGKKVYASGKVEAIVWYRTEVKLPLQRVDLQYTGRYVRHDYLVIGQLPVPVWGFSHPPYALSNANQVDEPLKLGDYKLPLQFRVDTVYEVKKVHVKLSVAQATARGMQFAVREVQRMTPDGTKVIRQNILQRKQVRGNLYVTVWSEALQNIGKPQEIPDAIQQ